MNTTRKATVSIFDSKGTIVIILINMILYFTLRTIPGIEDTLLLNPRIPMIMERPWTMLTVFFSHQILIHFLMNMGMMFIFGLELEKISGMKFLISLYMLAGLFGSLVIVPVEMLTGSQDLIAGASAAVFGIVTAFAVMRPDMVILKSKAKWWVLSLLSFNVVTIFINPQMSAGASAHIAGIIVGLLAGYWMKRNEYGEP